MLSKIYMINLREEYAPTIAGADRVASRLPAAGYYWVTQF